MSRNRHSRLENIEIAHARNERRARAVYPGERPEVDEISSLREAANLLYSSEDPVSVATQILVEFGEEPVQSEIFQHPRQSLPALSADPVRHILLDAAKYVVKARNSHKAAAEVAYVLGAQLISGMTETQIAKSIGVTRASISKNIKSLCNKWNLPPTLGMKSEKACSSYRRSRLRSSRKRKEAESKSQADFTV